ncbi:hypothetical protein [Lentimicrobium sp. S6]|uniref:hypothetical protein n=1 Tax=Lentimicrobium sp. S6 TaxID=2735872 RepID=UPI0015518F68|nr:hypothetical protein [Lentimicrobium sp. S6]NPD47855.1 hypothetical protein [Lentimicrobium sp. S6]
MTNLFDNLLEISLKQRAQKVLVYLLKPKADNSLVSWTNLILLWVNKNMLNLCNGKMAKEMIAENPELAKNHWMQCM